MPQVLFLLDNVDQCMDSDLLFLLFLAFGLH